MFPHPVPQLTRQQIQMQSPSPQMIWDTHALASKHPRPTRSSQKSCALADAADKGVVIKGSSWSLIQSKMDAHQSVVGTKP